MNSLKFLALAGFLAGLGSFVNASTPNMNEFPLKTSTPCINIFVGPVSSVDVDPEFARRMIDQKTNTIQNQINLIHELKRSANSPQAERDSLEYSERRARNARWYNTSLLAHHPQEDTHPKISQRRKIQMNDSSEAFRMLSGK